MKSQLEEQHTRLFAQCPALLGTRVPLLLLVVRAADRGRHPLAVQLETAEFHLRRAIALAALDQLLMVRQKLQIV